MQSTFVKKPDGALLTPVFRVTFPRVFKADDNGKFSCGMIFDSDVDFTPLERLVARTAKDKWGNKQPRNLMNPILDGDESDRADRENVKGKFYVNGKCGKFAPQVVDRQKQLITDPEEFYPGCYARAVITCYAWSHLGKNGVSVSIRNIQKVDDGDPLVSRVQPDDDFDDLPVDDDYDEDDV